MPENNIPPKNMQRALLELDPKIKAAIEAERKIASQQKKRFYAEIAKASQGKAIFAGKNLLRIENILDKADNAETSEISKATLAEANNMRLNSSETEQFVSLELDEFSRDLKSFTVNSPDKPKKLIDAQLAQIFRREYLPHAPTKNVHVKPGTYTQDQLITELLSTNPGIALADDHTRREGFDFFASHMALFKKNGVDTLYTEMSSQFFDKLDKLNASELRQLARDGKYKDIILPTPQQVAQNYHVSHADNSPIAFVNMLAAAKEQGIRVVGTDKEKGEFARNSEELADRVLKMNFIWTDAVADDRKLLKKPGKYIMYGGANHFITTNGMVSKALGIPVIAFEKGDPNALLQYRRGKEKSGVDFSLPGGMDYPDITLHSGTHTASHDAHEVKKPHLPVPAATSAQKR